MGQGAGYHYVVMMTKDYIFRMVCAILVLGLCLSLQAEESSSVEGISPRTWTSTRGDTVEAQFVELAGNTVCLKKSDGQKITIPLDNLCADDRALVKEVVGKGRAEKSSDSSRAPGTLSPEEIAAFKISYTNESTGREYSFRSRFGYRSLSRSERKKYAESGKIPVRITVVLDELKESDGRKRRMRLNGAARLYIIDSEGALVLKDKESLSKLCPS